jgi:periplasmic copper chaperone A
MRTTRRIVLVAASAATAVLIAAGTAAAHIDPDPAGVKPGSTTTVNFDVEHGCDGAPTTQLAFKVPKGATKVAAGAKDGWTGTTAGGVVTFSGGSQPGDQPTDFPITFKATHKKGTVLVWKIVQRCGKTVERWLGKESDDLPAARILVTNKKVTPPQH